MNAIDREPTRDELLAQAYVDGELPETDRHAFEKRLALEPALGREVAELQGLAVLARQVAPPEPMDFEWKRLAKDPVHQGGHTLGFALLAVGLSGLTLLAVVAIGSAEDLAFWPKALILAVLGGITLLFLTVLRGRLRTMSLDPYTKVER